MSSNFFKVTVNAMSNFVSKLAGGKKAKSELNFFQNYNLHLNALDHNFVKEYQSLGLAKDFGEALSDAALAHATIFEPLRDAYDYADEFVGATAVPFLSVIACVAGVCNALFEAGQLLAIKCNLMSDDNEEHSSIALFSLVLAGAALVVAMTSFIKSALSLVFRPISTAVNGYKAQDEVRFADEMSTDESLFNEITSTLG